MKARIISRREATTTFLALLGGAAAIFACGDGDADGTSNATGSTGTGDGGTSSSTDVSAGEWASGGTQAMTASASYPNPFATAAATACVLIPSATEGPCTEAADQVRKDISEGYPGLPVRLALRVVDADCNPVASAKVKIWHTQITGSYSGNTPNNNMCLKDQSDSSKHYFRGAQTSDSDGRVDFDTCFPGWYRGRTVHIHFSVTANGKSYTSQLVFADDLVAEIFETHADYEQYGQPDTTNTSDNIVANSVESHTLTTARMSDGAMLASKQLVVSV